MLSVGSDQNTVAGNLLLYRLHPGIGLHPDLEGDVGGDRHRHAGHCLVLPGEGADITEAQAIFCCSCFLKISLKELLMLD